ncbi:MAG: ABC transporter ATP-binding protein [Clostridia bacterium]|nr:ABC transporter ATP-binding protein [Clostridia bacterium]
MDNILEVSGLAKRYPSFAVDNLSFSLPEGCVTGFIGANGAGKTTTIRAILGLARKDAGKIKVFGLDADRHGRAIRDRIGIVMDGSYFYDELSMKEMKSIIAPAYSQWSDSDYRAYMDRFGLDPKQKISTLSSGMKMKFALVLALSHRAELLIMDEPTSGLDPLVRSQFLEIIMDYMKNGGRGVFFSSHIISDLDKVADMLILIDSGKIVFQRSRDELLDAFRTVKGNAAQLNEDTRSLIRSLKVSPFGFTGLTDRAEELKKKMPEALLERASLEDIMLAYIGGGNDENR